MVSLHNAQLFNFKGLKIIPAGIIGCPCLIQVQKEKEPQDTVPIKVLSQTRSEAGGDSITLSAIGTVETSENSETMAISEKEKSISVERLKSKKVTNYCT